MEQPTYNSPLANYYSQFGSGPGGVSRPTEYYTWGDFEKNKSTNAGGAIPKWQQKPPGASSSDFSPWVKNPGQAGNDIWSPNMQASQRQVTTDGTGASRASHRAQTFGVLDQARYSNQLLFGAQEQMINQATAARVGGIDAALAETDRFSQAGYQRAKDFGIEASSGADLDSISSGLFNSSERVNAQRAVQGDTFRRFLDVDSAYAQARSQLQMQRGQATAQGFQNLGNLYEKVRMTNEDSYIYEFDARLGRRSPQATQSADSGTDWGAVIGSVVGIVASIW